MSIPTPPEEDIGAQRCEGSCLRHPALEPVPAAQSLSPHLCTQSKGAAGSSQDPVIRFLCKETGTHDMLGTQSRKDLLSRVQHKELALWLASEIVWP